MTECQLAILNGICIVYFRESNLNLTSIICYRALEMKLWIKSLYVSFYWTITMFGP